ncbi:MAG: hypothetical protein A2201_03995 [Alicyclobacillus sp. RIFOXYA1_FULL_53_8]|nr:MAG: hypothetical protein A2201_03995 [Alicyclobacillus sp. RIFOXYA1_FULL_53_8]
MAHSMNPRVDKSERALIQTLRSMGSAVGTALIATVLGFAALFISPVPMVGDFGKMLSIGVIVSFFMSMLVLTTILFIRDRFFPKSAPMAGKTLTRRWTLPGKAKANPGVLDRVLQINTKIALRLRFFILVGAVVLTMAGLWADRQIGVQTDVEQFMPRNTPALEQIHVLRRVVGSTDQVSLLVTGNNVLAPTSLRWMDATTEGVKQQFPQIVTDSQSITSVMRMANNDEVYSTAGGREFHYWITGVGAKNADSR